MLRRTVRSSCKGERVTAAVYGIGNLNRLGLGNANADVLTAQIIHRQGGLGRRRRSDPDYSGRRIVLHCKLRLSRICTGIR